MAGDAKSLPADGEDRHCKYCKSGVEKGVKCIVCKSWLHASCALRVTGLKVVSGSKSLIKCSCVGAVEQQTQTNTDQDIEPISLDKGNIDVLTLEVYYLKQLLKEMTDSNNILKQNNGLLTEKICMLESDKQTTETCRNSKKTLYRDTLIGAATSASSCDVGTDRKLESQHENGNNTTSTNILVPQMGPRQGRRSSAGSAVSYRRTTESRLMQAGTDHRDISQEPKQHFRQPKRFGTGETPLDAKTKGFTGGERRVWISLYRVLKTATSEIVHNYIKSKEGFQDVRIIVKEITVPEDQLKSFVVVAPLSKKDDLYNTEFWPKNVGIRRFDFNKHRDFINNTTEFFP